MRKKRSKASNDKMIATRIANRKAKLAERAEHVDEIAAHMREAAEWLMRAEKVLSKPHTEAELFAMVALKKLTMK
jgi:hypothetical protein